MALPTSPHTPETFAETEDEEFLGTTEEERDNFTREDLAQVLADQQRLSDERLEKILRGAQPKGQPLQEEIKVPGLSYEGLPHPTHDLDGFLKGLEERRTAREKVLIDQVMRQTEQRVEQRTDQKVQAQTLFQRAERLLQEAAPELSEDQLGYAATRVADRYKARGINPQEALQSDLVGVSQEVLDFALETFGDREEEPLIRTGGRGNRTGGITPSGGRLPKPKAKETEPTTLVQEIRQFQVDNRLY
jgi:hypothetical protein